MWNWKIWGSGQNVSFLIKDYTLRTNEIKRYTYGINVMLWWIALCGLYNRNEQGKKIYGILSSPFGIYTAFFLFYSVSFSGASRSPQRDFECLMSWYHADWLHGCIPWKKGWGVLWWGNHSCLGRSLFQVPLHMYLSVIHSCIFQVELTKGTVNGNPCMNTLVLLCVWWGI